MLSDKKQQGGNGGTVVLFILIAVFMGISYFLSDPAKEKIAQNEYTETMVNAQDQNQIVDSNKAILNKVVDSAEITAQARQRFGTFASAANTPAKILTIKTPKVVYTFNISFSKD